MAGWHRYTGGPGGTVVGRGAPTGDGIGCGDAHRGLRPGGARAGGPGSCPEDSRVARRSSATATATATATGGGRTRSLVPAGPLVPTRCLVSVRRLVSARVAVAVRP